VKKNNTFERLGNILNPNNNDFETVFIAPDYALETLINGNISECIKYLRALIGTGLTGMKEAADQLMKIKEQDPERYQYINNKVYGS